jgi:succinate dehydrogenase (ubiquinone) cytochrome b560 subunit
MFVAFFSGGLGSSNSNLEQAKGYSSSPLGDLLSKMSPSGSRPLHTSRPLSSPVANRPLSPHLPLKKPQLSATFSITHRIFGVALGAAIISIPLATKFSVMCGVWSSNYPFIDENWQSSGLSWSGFTCNATVDAVGITSVMPANLCNKENYLVTSV